MKADAKLLGPGTPWQTMPAPNHLVEVAWVKLWILQAWSAQELVNWQHNTLLQISLWTPSWSRPGGKRCGCRPIFSIAIIIRRHLIIHWRMSKLCISVQMQYYTNHNLRSLFVADEHKSIVYGRSGANHTALYAVVDLDSTSLAPSEHL